MPEIREAVHAYILRHFLPGEDPDELTDQTPLITGGILDSIRTLKLVVFLEDTFGVTMTTLSNSTLVAMAPNRPVPWPRLTPNTYTVPAVEPTAPAKDPPKMKRPLT